MYAVEFSHRSGRDLINMATHRTNVIPIVGMFRSLSVHSTAIDLKLKMRLSLLRRDRLQLDILRIIC